MFLLKLGRSRTAKRHATVTFAKKLFDWVNSIDGRTLEAPSFNIHGNAHSIAKLGSVIVNGGEVDGIRLFSAATIKEALSEPRREYDPYLQSTYSFTKGGFASFDDFDSGMVQPHFKSSLKGFYGWGGIGGSLFVFNPDLKVSVGYAMNGMAFRGLGGPSSDRILQAVRVVLDKEFKDDKMQ